MANPLVELTHGFSNSFLAYEVALVSALTLRNSYLRKSHSLR